MQSTKRNEHSHKVAIDDLILEVDTFCKDGQETIITTDGNKEFLSAEGE